MADEWKEYDIRTNCIAPGLIATPGVRTRLGVEVKEIPPRGQVDRHIGYPEETDDIAQFLASPAASYLNGSMVRAGMSSCEEAECEEPE